MRASPEVAHINFTLALYLRCFDRNFATIQAHRMPILPSQMLILLLALAGALCKGASISNKQYKFSHSRDLFAIFARVFQQNPIATNVREENNGSETRRPPGGQTPITQEDGDMDPRNCVHEPWSEWGPKTPLFGCGRRHRSRTVKTGGTQNCDIKLKDEQRSCKGPKFRQQKDNFNKYFFQEMQNQKKRERDPLDLVFLVDQANSLSRGDFRRIRDTVANLTEKLELDSRNQVAMVTFSREPKLRFKFTNDTKMAVNNIKKVPKSTTGMAALQPALDYCRHLFNPAENFGARKNGVRRVLLVFTDGAPVKKLDDVALQLQVKQNVEIFAVGFSSMKDEQLTAISSYPKGEHMFYFRTPGEVHKMVRFLE
eukprot:m.83631 g.83631  ORF g.83631 m.83631 type:complete len:370 (+) comp36360_c1_seq5:1872-2981(+)